MYKLLIMYNDEACGEHVLRFEKYMKQMNKSKNQNKLKVWNVSSSTRFMQERFSSCLANKKSH